MDRPDEIAGRIPDHLKALKSAATAASVAYHAHHYNGDKSDLDAEIAYDIEDARLLTASVSAKMAYEDALAAFMKAEAA